MKLLISSLLGCAAAEHAMLSGMAAESDECAGCDVAPEPVYQCLNPPCDDGVCGAMPVDPDSCEGDKCTVQCSLETGYYRDNNNCRAYCYCSGEVDDGSGTAVPSRWQVCPEGTFWDDDCRGFHEILKSDGYKGGCCNHPAFILNFADGCDKGCQRLSKYFCIKSKTCSWNDDCNCCLPGGPEEPEAAVTEEAPSAKKKCKGKKLDMSFIVDGSGSIGPVNFDATREFLKALISNFDLGPTQVSLVQYSYDDKIEFQNLADFGEIESTIDNMPYQAQGTWTGVALDFWAQNFVGRDDAGHVTMVFTDGVSYDTPENDVSIMGPKLQATQDKVIAVGVAKADAAQLAHIASDPDSDNVVLKTWDELESMAMEIAEKMCS